MQILVLCALLAAVSAFVAVSDTRPLIDEDLIHLIASSGASWEATLQPRFASWTLQDAKNFLPQIPKHGRPTHFPIKEAHVGAIPSAFDARTQWPGAIHPIQDQGQCSAVSYAATEVMSDRFAIQTNLSTNVVLSAADLAACSNPSQGCNGGYPIDGWNYLVSHGVLTSVCNGDTNEKCNLSTGSPCPSGTGTVQYYQAASAYAVGTTVEAIQTEIMTNGPIQVSFDVYQDFFSYSSGVYTHKTGSLAGGTVVKMLGWGILSGVDYWICANSWGSDWGMQGYFLIRRGVDECGIESAGYAGLAKTTITF